MRIGTVEIQGRAALAPMAGVADRAFRKICVDYGAGYVVGEMVSCKGLCVQDAKSRELLRLDDEERPAAVQLFGDDPDIMARAAVLAMEYRPDVIDINMGCPAPKIAGNHCGSALMREPDLCRRIVQAVARAVPVPVTAKIRKGYGPPVDWDIIRAVKEAVGIPVIGNGDVTTAREAAALYEQTGCDLVMVGRGALGAPWLFAQIEAYLNHGQELPPPPVSSRMAVLYRQIELAVSLKGERVALREARKHAAWYMRGLKGAAGFRGEAGQIASLADLGELCRRVIEANE